MAKSKKFQWDSSDITVSEKPNIPKRLQKIVSGAPRADKEKAEYLQGLVSDGKISLRDLAFLMQSGVLS